MLNVLKFAEIDYEWVGQLGLSWFGEEHEAWSSCSREEGEEEEQCSSKKKNMKSKKINNIYKFFFFL